MGTGSPRSSRCPLGRSGDPGAAWGPVAATHVLCPAVTLAPLSPHSPPGAAGEDAGAGEAGRGAAAAGGERHPALRAARLQAGGHEAAPGSRPHPAAACPPGCSPRPAAGSGGCREEGVSRGHQPGVPAVTARCRQADQGLLDKHYQQLRQKPFYPALLAYMTSGPLVAMVRGRAGGFWGPRRGTGGLRSPLSRRCGRATTWSGPRGPWWGTRTRRRRQRAPSGGTSACTSAGRGAGQAAGPAAGPHGHGHCHCPRAGMWSTPATRWRRPGGRSASGSSGTSWWPGRAETGTTPTGPRVAPAGTDPGPQ